MSLSYWLRAFFGLKIPRAKKSGQGPERRPLARWQRTVLRLEALEDRALPSIAASFTGAFSLTAAAPVNISKLAGSQDETNIAIDPTNPARMFATSNIHTTNAIFAGFSTDAGVSWTTRLM